ncbi:MAG TPA: PLP-dependent aminotransferase family protein [Ktedonobacterales bacterium]|nr:PLP-dependent aminotransferase family protein [Ktedonobacterales bacterium]
MIQERSVDLLITLDRTERAGEGLTRQLYHQLRAAILSGRLRAGERLPPTRDFAAHLGVARLTVATAYDWLRTEGYVFGRVGAGTFVAPALGDLGGAHESSAISLTTPPPRQRAAEVIGTPPVPLSAWARRIATIPLAGVGSDTDAPFNFSPGAGAADAFPWARWRRSVGWQDPADRSAERLARARESAARVGHWDALLGPLETRQAIAAWLRRSRAVRCEPDQVLIAGSVQQVLSLLARLLMEPGQRLIVEDPSYVGFHAAFLAEGATLDGIPVDENGIVVGALPDPASARQSEEAHLAVVTPSHQYPTGVTLALDRRLALLDWARRAGVVVVEDDYDGDLRLEGQPLEALRGLDDRDEVIYLGTFAKALYPAVRLAYAVLPAWLVEPVARARAASDRHPTWRDALAVARFIDAGELERHLARMRRLYRSRRDALVAALRTVLGDLVTIGPAEAGIHLLLGLPTGVSDVALSDVARERGIGLTPLSPHYFRQARSGLLLGFGALDEDQLARGVERLAPLIERAVERGQ